MQSIISISFLKLNLTTSGTLLHHHKVLEVGKVSGFAGLVYELNMLEVSWGGGGQQELWDHHGVL